MLALAQPSLLSEKLSQQCGYPFSHEVRENDSSTSSSQTRQQERKKSGVWDCSRPTRPALARPCSRLARGQAAASGLLGRALVPRGRGHAGPELRQDGGRAGALARRAASRWVAPVPTPCPAGAETKGLARAPRGAVPAAGPPLCSRLTGSSQGRAPRPRTPGLFRPSSGRQ